MHPDGVRRSVAFGGLMDAVEAAAREREAKASRYVRGLRTDLVRFGVDRVTVQALSVKELIVTHRRALIYLQTSAPGSHKQPWHD